MEPLGSFHHVTVHPQQNTTRKSCFWVDYNDLIAVENPMLKVLDCTRHTLAFGLLGVNVIGRNLQ